MYSDRTQYAMPKKASVHVAEDEYYRIATSVGPGSYDSADCSVENLLRQPTEQVITVAASAFMATNLDDLMLLTVFFAEVQASAHTPGGLKASQVVVGQYLGFTVLVVVSMLGYVIGHFVAPKWIGLLGFVPIVIGIKSYLSMCLCPEEDGDGSVDEGHPSNRVAGYGAMGAVGDEDLEGLSSNAANREGGDQGGNSRDGSVVSADESARGNVAVRVLRRALNPGVMRVGLLIVANGADNIAIYTPLFAASRSGWRIWAILLVFYVMVGVWCLLGWGFVRIPIITRAIRSYGDFAVPLMLIGLGVYILLERDSLSLLGAKPICW